MRVRLVLRRRESTDERLNYVDQWERFELKLLPEMMPCPLSPPPFILADLRFAAPPGRQLVAITLES